MSSDCQSNDGCATTAGDGAGDCCPDGVKDCGCPATQALLNPCCPVEKSISLWAPAFPAAMRAVQVDLLKDRIRKAWGPVLEAQADVLVETMGAMWHANLAQGLANRAAREKFQKILEQAFQNKK